MNFKILMVTKAVVSLSFGILFVIVPSALMEFFGASLEPGGVFVARAMGAAGIGIAVLAWLNRDTVEFKIQRPVLLMILVDDAIGLVVSVLAVTSNVLNGLGWLIAVTYLFLTVSPGYLLSKGPAIAGEPTTGLDYG